MIHCEDRKLQCLFWLLHSRSPSRLALLKHEGDHWAHIVLMQSHHSIVYERQSQCSTDQQPPNMSPWHGDGPHAGWQMFP